MAKITINQALLKAVEAYRAGDIEAAKRLLSKIIQIEPDQPDANENMGKILAASGDFEAALPFFNAALEANFGSAQFWYSYIDCHIRLEHFEVAKSLLDSARAKGAEGKAFDHLRLQLAEMDSRKLKTWPLINESLKALINLYKKGHKQQALDEALELLEQFPHSAALHNTCGFFYAAFKKFDEAIIEYKEALKIMPALDQAYWGIVNAQNNKQSLDGMISPNKEEERTDFIISEKWFDSLSVISPESYSVRHSFAQKTICSETLVKKENLTIVVINKPKTFLKLNGRIQILSKMNSYYSDVENKWIVNGLVHKPLCELHQSFINHMIEGINANEGELELTKSENYIPIGGHGNYGHFLFEFLPKIIWALSTIGSDCNFIINKCSEKWLDLINILSIILCKKIPNYTIIDQTKITKFSCPNPTFIESAFSTEGRFVTCFKTLNILNLAIINKYQKQSPQKKLYLARENKPASVRQLENKEEIRSIFQEKDYKVLFMSEFSQEEQLKILANASDIVVEAGADSLATIFCPPKCKITELIPENFVNISGPFSSHVPLKQSYLRLEGEVKKMATSTLAINHNFIISPELVKNIFN